jgi:SAM-dependent methyltransferase
MCRRTKSSAESWGNFRSRAAFGENRGRQLEASPRFSGTKENCSRYADKAEAEMSESAEAMYRSSSAYVRASFGTNQKEAFDYYAPLVEFVSGLRRAQGAGQAVQLLDVGCGSGWSTHAFASTGYEATGIDLNPAAFEPPPHPSCQLREGSATEIPFPDGAFDVVVCYQCLEHVPSPARALDEMARVCRPDGVVAVIGPNLLSPYSGFAIAARQWSWRSLRFRRRPNMPRHPYGNTVPEVVAFGLLRGIQLSAKLVQRTPHFTMREPDTRPPFHGDNDACYMCNPTDLISYFRGRGFQIERRGKPGRLPLSYLFAGGTWIAARKPLTQG